MLIATPATGLGRVPGINPDYLYPLFLSFVIQECVELGKAPTVQFAFVVNVLVLFPSPYLGGISDVDEVFQHDRAARSSMLDNAFGEDMIAIPVESQALTRQLLEVSFGAFCSFGLQFSLEAETAAVYFFPMPTSQEVTVGSHGRTIESQVYPDDFRVLWDSRFRHTHHYMQPELPMSVAQVSSSYSMTIVPGTIRGDAKGDTHFTMSGRKTYYLFLPIECVGMYIVAYWTEFTLRTLDRFERGDRLVLLLSFSYAFGVISKVFGLPRQGRFHCLSSLDTSLNEQVRDQSGTSYFSITISGMMQLYPVTFLVLPSIGNYRVKGMSKLLKCLCEDLSLLRGGLQLYLHRPVHTESIPYMPSFCNAIVEKGEAAFPP